MPQLFHQLRTRSRAFAHGLLLVLVVTWLSAVCPHCLAQAAETPAMPAHCHPDAPPPVEHMAGGHDCCQHDSTPGETGCSQLSTVTTYEAPTVAASAASVLAVLPGDVFNTLPAIPAPTTPLAYTAPTDPCPLYLRHCVFRN
ncbi:MAG: hypothetical protein HZB57_11035 [Gammaproteobacteria bacterium]|nr:hypothetical protein [Gammaproteobacteria bacterium]